MRILINHLKNVGDVLLATTAIKLVRDRYPDAWITLMTVQHVAPFFENHPLIDEILPLAYKSKENSVSSMLKMVKEVRKRNFDINISLESRFRPLLLAFLAGIPVRIAGDGMDRYGKKKEWYSFLFTDFYPITMQEKEHQSETFMKVVRPFLRLPATITARPSMPPASEESKARMRTLLQIEKGQHERKKFLFCVRGTHPEKNWPCEYFAAVIAEARKKYGADCFIVGAPSDYDYAQAVAEKCQEPVYNICGKTKPEDLVALFTYADLLVSVDTGTAHIAATTEIPIVSIFLCTNPIQWHPLSEKAKVLCYEFAFGRFGLMPTPDFITRKEILPEHIMQAIEEQLADRK